MKREKFQVRSSVPLKGHHGCVNAMALTNEAICNRFLVTAGDDRRLLLWDTYSPLYFKSYAQHFTEHDSNILTLSIDCTNQKVFSGGNGNAMYINDLLTGKKVSFVGGSVWRIKCHPTNPDLAVSILQRSNPAEGPRLSVHDTRTGSFNCIYYGHDVLVDERLPDDHTLEGVDINPIDPNLVALGGDDYCSLIDLRMMNRNLMTYVVPIKRTSFTQSSDVCFHSRGLHFISCQQNYLPTLYSIYEKKPLAVFYGKDYTNIPTVKSLTFAEYEGETYVIAGSDNKNMYIWKVPLVLLSVKSNNYMEGSLKGSFYDDSLIDGVGVIDSPIQIVSGAHKGNVNNVLYHPTLQRIYGSGVEKTVWQHNLHRLPQQKDRVVEDAMAEEDTHMLSYFEFMNATSLPLSVSPESNRLHRLMEMALDTLSFTSRSLARRTRNESEDNDEGEDEGEDEDEDNSEEDNNEEDDFEEEEDDFDDDDDDEEEEE